MTIVFYILLNTLQGLLDICDWNRSYYSVYLSFVTAIKVFALFFGNIRLIKQLTYKIEHGDALK